MPNYNTQLQSNNVDLTNILNLLNELPNKDYSENEDAIITKELDTYVNNVITNIGNNAFAHCSNLTTVSFPACTVINGEAFQHCSSLTTVSFPVCTSIGYNAFYDCSSLTTVSFPVCTTISNYAFAHCSSLTTVSFPTCTIIGSNAFYKCSNLTTVSFPACSYIDYDAFGNCSSLTTVSLPACTTISNYAFWHCFNLKSLYLTGSRLCTLLNSNALTSTPIGGYSASAGTYGSIYVPASLLTSYQIATNWTYFSSRFVAFDSGANIITFTIDMTEYQAEEGMTWAEWVESEYNTLGFYEYYDEVALDTGYPAPEFICYQDFEYCKSSELIINSYSYVVSV